MASRLLSVCGTGVVLLSALVLVMLPTSSASFCEPDELNVTGSNIADYIEENRDKLSDCCRNNSQEKCLERGGFCIPSWLGQHCPSNDPQLCGHRGCTCCLPQECSGSCSSGGRNGVCRSTCNSNEDAVPGKCSSGNCVCCVKKHIITPRYFGYCNGVCRGNGEICIPRERCLAANEMETFEWVLDEHGKSCGPWECTCCPWYLDTGK